jgi:hypothetical protein
MGAHDRERTPTAKSAASKARDTAADSGKVTIKVGFVDLGQIGLRSPRASTAIAPTSSAPPSKLAGLTT